MIFVDLQKEPYDLPPPIDAFHDNKRPPDAGFFEWLGLWQLPLQVRGCGGLRGEPAGDDDAARQEEQPARAQSHRLPRGRLPALPRPATLRGALQPAQRLHRRGCSGLSAQVVRRARRENWHT